MSALSKSQAPSPRREALLKCALINHLQKHGELPKNAVVANEFVVDEWANRADIVVANGHLAAFEIKSSADKLKRLPDQLNAFQRFFDRVTVVVEERHLSAARKQLPKGVGLWLVMETKKSFKFHVIKKGRAKNISDKNDLAHMLTVNELRRFLISRKVNCRMDARKELLKKVIEQPTSSLRAAVLESIKLRYTETDRAFRRATKKGRMTVENLKVLSRYNAQKKLQKKTNDWSFLVQQPIEADVFALWNKHHPSLFGLPPSDIYQKLKKSN